MQVIGSPIGSPTPSRRASPSPTRHKSASSSRKSSAASRRSRKSAYNNSNNTSAYLTEIEQDPAVDMSAAEEEVRQPITPPATPETGNLLQLIGLVIGFPMSLLTTKTSVS